MAASLVVRLLPLLFLAAWEVGAASDGQSPRRDRVKIPKNCPPCDVRQCTTMTPESCNGHIIKDRCHCCPVCALADDGDVFNYTSLAEQTARNQCKLNHFHMSVCACNLGCGFDTSRPDLSR